MTIADGGPTQTSQFWDRGYALVDGLPDDAKLRFATRAIDASDSQGAMRRRADASCSAIAAP